MSTLTALDLSKYELATPAAHDLQPGDVIGVSGDWCVIVSFPVDDQPVNPMWVEIEVAPIDQPDRPRAWQIMHDARMAVLRANDQPTPDRWCIKHGTDLYGDDQCEYCEEEA